MAHVKNIWMFEGDRGTDFLTLFVALKPSGEVQIKVPIPPSFREAISAIAQNAADLHEAQMKAEILGDQHVA